MNITLTSVSKKSMLEKATSVRSDIHRTRGTDVRSKEFAQKSRRRSDAPLTFHEILTCVRIGGIHLLDGCKLVEDRTRLSRWTESPDIFLVQGGTGTTLNERVNPVEGNPLEDGEVVFRGILDRLNAYTEVSGR